MTRARTAGRARWLCLLGLVWALVPLKGAADPITVTIEGVEGALLDNVRAYLRIVEQTERSGDGRDLPASTVRRLHKAAPDEIERALKPFGYYEPTIDAELAEVEGGWRARYRIEPGKPVRIRQLAIRIEGDGAEDAAFTERVEQLPLAEGAQLNHSDYETAKDQLMRLAAERGYLEAQWRQRRLEIDPQARAARIELTLDTGPGYRFGRIRFEDTVVSESLLRRYLDFAEGQAFDARRLLELQYRLDDSDYFREVSVRDRRDQASDHKIPVDVGLKSRAKHRYQFGVGFATDTGARVRFGRETRYLNDRGHRFQTTLLIAERATEAQARYIIPLADPWRERLEIDTRLTEEEIGGGETRQFELGTARITNSGGWQRRLSLTYQRSRDEIGGDVATRNLVLPGIALSRGRFDDPVYTTRGYSISGKLTGGASSLGSDVSFSRLRLQGSGLRRLWPDARIIGRVELGRVWVDEFSQLPLSQRFYAGGDSSVRGFAYQSLGPEDAQGRVIGGRYLGVASLELEQLVWGDWGAAVFVDHGNAVAEIGDDLRTGAGVGLRYRSPVGVIRVDVAKAVDGDESPRLHLSLGVNF